MRVGLLIYGSLSTLSGGYLYDRKLAEHLRAAGDEVEIISVPWRNYAAHLADNFSAELRQHLLNGQWDVLLEDELNHPSLFLLNGWLKGRVRYPIISIVHHLRSSELRPRWQNALYGLIEHAYLRRVDGFIFNSETTREVVRERVKKEGKNVPHVVAYPAADHVITSGLKAPASPSGRGGRGVRILFIGNVIPRKGLHTLIKALVHVRGAWQLTVAGRLDVDEGYVRRLQAETHNTLAGTGNASLRNNVVWLGRLSDEELQKQLAAHDVLAVPSSYEGFGIVYLEALAHGLPVIATTAGAAHEIITPGREGFLVPPENHAALAQVLQTLMDDGELLQAMSRAARARYAAWPTWAQSMGRVRTLLLSGAV